MPESTGPLVELTDPEAAPHAPPGHCVRCRHQTFDVLAAALVGPEGWPLRLGAALPSFAWRAFLLDSGHRVPAPLCGDCAADPGDLGTLWAATVAAGRHNAEQRTLAALAMDATAEQAASWRAASDAKAARLRRRHPVALVPLRPAHPEAGPEMAL
jgi:hypothetical protein